MKVLLLHTVWTRQDSIPRVLLPNFDPDLRLSVLRIEHYSRVRWALKLIKQTIKALSIYRRYDLVLSNGMGSILPLAFVHSFLHRSRPKFVGVDISTNRAGPSLTRVIKIAVKSLNAIICYTTAQRNWWARTVGYSRARFVSLGLDHGSLLNSIETVKTENDSYIFSGGRVARDYRTLLRAASELHHRVLLVAASDPVTAKTGLEQADFSNVEVYFNVCSYDRFLELMSKAWLVVLALHDTPYAAGQMVLLDAMAMGKPIIVTRTVGTIDYVDDGKTALFVEPGNVLQLKEKILLLSKNAELRRTLGRNAKSKWEKEFTLRAMAERVSGVIASVL